jgi:tRNA modification GTPase
MYQYKGLEDTIAAIATPFGTGGLGIVRLSGKDAFAIASKFVHLKSGKVLIKCPGYTVHYGWAEDTEIIDEVLVTIMRGPKSYTAEDVVEVSCHGGLAALKAVLNTACKNGARLAEAGEFTKRAFLNGRIDLAQAEAVLDIIRAKTDTFLRVSNNQLKGELSSELEGIRGELMGIYIALEALINFPEDDVDTVGRKKIEERIKAQALRVNHLLKSAHNGRILKEGIRIVLCGKPNVGKSSLLNVLLKQQRAIVTNIAGTTRDVLEEQAQIKGIPFQLVDTAGILEPRDLVEEEAIKRSHLYIDSADLVLLVLDNSKPLEPQDQLLIEKLKGRNILVVINKNDLPSQLNVPYLAGLFKGRILPVSATHKNAIEELEAKIVESVVHEDIDTHGILISNIRHINALTEAHSNINQAADLMSKDNSFEFISEDIKSAINQLDGITGRNIDQDLLDRIFSEFCIGK